MRRASVGNFGQPCSLLVVEVAAKGKGAVDLANTACVCFAIIAVLHLDTTMIGNDVDGFERPLLGVRVHA